MLQGYKFSFGGLGATFELDTIDMLDDWGLDILQGPGTGVTIFLCFMVICPSSTLSRWHW